MQPRARGLSVYETDPAQALSKLKLRRKYKSVSLNSMEFRTMGGSVNRRMGFLRRLEIEGVEFLTAIYMRLALSTSFPHGYISEILVLDRNVKRMGRSAAQC